MPRSSRLARADLGGASGGAVGKAACGRNALQAGGLGLRATRRPGLMRAVPHTFGSTPKRTQRLTMRCRRTAPRVTVAAIHVRSRLVRARRCLTSVASFFAPPSQLPRRAPQSLSLGSLGDFAHLIRAMSASEDIPSPMPATKCHALKTSSSESIASRTFWPSVASRRFCCPAFPDSGSRESPASSTAFLLSVYREADTSRRSTRNSPERLDIPAAFSFVPSRAFTESQLSRHPRSGIHRESGRASRNSFRASVLNPTSPNHALQRTAPRVTVAAISSSNPSPASHLSP